MALSYIGSRVHLVSFVSLLIFSSSGLSSDVHREYPISSKVVTTLERTIVPEPVPSSSPKLFPYELSKYKHYGYGKWHYGPGLPFEKRLDIMSSTYTGDSATPDTELLHFFTITDLHIRDKECPAQAIYLGSSGIIPLPGAYSGTMLYTTQIFDAIVRTINALHNKKPFDFGISLGDTCNATQYNELRWYLDVLDGKVIRPSSGAHAGEHTIDYQKPFKAAGLNKKIHWYQAIGNHDHFWFGSLPPNGYIRHALIGRKILNLGNPFTNPLGVNSRGFYMGAIDGSTPFGNIIGAGIVKDFTYHPKVPARDPNRRSLSRYEWIREFFKTSSHPKGHGFKKSNVKTGFACYAFEPKSDIPIKIIVLDDTESDDAFNNPLSLGYGHGALSKKRYDWLIRELDKGQSKNQLMIIAAHIPIGVASPNAIDGWSDFAFEMKLIDKLHTYPNLILWIAGHRHINAVTELPSPDPSHPELGFWEVETASLIGFPQQFRTFRIVRNSDNTISIFTANVDAAVKKGSLAATSRFYSMGIRQIYNDPIFYPPTGSYNAQLLKQLTPKMQAKIQHCGTPILKNRKG